MDTKKKKCVICGHEMTIREDEAGLTCACTNKPLCGRIIRLIPAGKVRVMV